MKKLFTLIVVCLMAVSTWAYDVEVGGIYYNLNTTEKTAEVTKGTNKYTGSVTIPETIVSDGVTYSVTSIGSSAFYGCTGLTSVTIPNSVTTIGEWAFSSCHSLTSVTIPNSVTTIGGHAFYQCSGLTSVTIGNSVTNIGDGAFFYCTGLTSVTIPNSVTSIGVDAFYGCTGVKTISIGTGITSIGQQAFANCRNVETVTCYAEEVPTSGTDVFSDSPVSSATLKVPDTSVVLYTNADQWKEFGTIVGVMICATPTISLKDGKVVATSGTEGATCNVSYQINGSDGTYTLDVTAYATADNYAQSETATETYPLSVGVFGDINGDGTVNIVDVNSLVNKLLGK